MLKSSWERNYLKLGCQRRINVSLWIFIIFGASFSVVFNFNISNFQFFQPISKNRKSMLDLKVIKNREND